MDPSQFMSCLIQVNLDQKDKRGLKKEKSKDHATDKLSKEEAAKKGVAKYICDDSESDEDSHDGIFEGNDDEDELNNKNLLSKMEDPSPLIDGDLINLLTFCQELYH
jgi:hypothetical protein